MFEVFVVDLANVGIADLAQVGGKAAGLGELLRIGLPVRTGFCVTTAAFRHAVHRTESDVGGALPVMPEAVAEAIRQATLALGDQPLAVRSSATAEDLPSASFAGQQETLLNVRGPDAVTDAVRQCWASLGSSRAIAYRRRFGVDQEDLAMAVLVQVLVPAEVAGVLFTANPISGRRDEIVVNASFGLGEGVVSGLVTPDTYVLDKTTFDIKTVHIGHKAMTVVLAEQGGTTALPTPQARVDNRALTDEQLRVLAELARRAEGHFGGSPQDIEWAFAGDQCALLQSRPVTSLPSPPLEHVRWDPPAAGSVWVRRQVAENLPEPLSPLFDELYVQQGLERSLDAVLAFFKMPWFHLEDISDPPFFTTINGYAYQRANFKFDLKTLGLALRGAFNGWQVMWSDAVPFWRDQALPSYLATVQRWKAHDPAQLTDAQLLEGIRELAWADATYWYACAVVVANAKWTDALLDRFLAVAAPRRRLTSGLFLRGFASRSLAAQAALQTIADRIRCSDDLLHLIRVVPSQQLRAAFNAHPQGRLALQELDTYLDQFGHQIYNLDFVEPTQVENPLPVLLSLKALVEHPSNDARARQQQLAAESRSLVATTARSFDPVRRRLFRTLVRWAERFGPYREEALFFMGAGWPTLRRLAIELGRRCVTVAALDSADDVFYLGSAELASALGTKSSDEVRCGLAQVAGERHALRERRKRLHAPAAVPPSRGLRFGPLNLGGFETQRRNSDAECVLRGFAVSPGRITASASVILSASDFVRMQPDTILVCPTTTPAWTPLFAQARGLVTDVGGILAHGSIVAREYGIPAVMGTGNATQRIVHGQLITIDGDLGNVDLTPAKLSARAGR